MKAWRWLCITHGLSLLTLQTGDHPPTACSGLAEIVYPDDGPCWLEGSPVLHMFPGREAPRVPTPSSRSGIVPGLAEADYPSPLPVTRT